MLTTGRKDKLPRGWSYPVGAQTLTAALGGVPGFENQPLRFHAPTTAHPATSAELTVLSAMMWRGRWADDAGKRLWSISIGSIPGIHRQKASRTLEVFALPLLRRWLWVPRTDYMLERQCYFSVRMTLAPVEFTIEVKEVATATLEVTAVPSEIWDYDAERT